MEPAHLCTLCPSSYYGCARLWLLPGRHFYGWQSTAFSSTFMSWIILQNFSLHHIPSNTLKSPLFPMFTVSCIEHHIWNLLYNKRQGLTTMHFNIGRISHLLSRNRWCWYLTLLLVDNFPPEKKITFAFVKNSVFRCLLKQVFWEPWIERNWGLRAQDIER